MLLQEIALFPEQYRELLKRKVGIVSAESFFESGVRNADGMQRALKMTPTQLAELMKIVENYLSPEFVKSCGLPVARHKRGVITEM